MAFKNHHWQEARAYDKHLMRVADHRKEEFGITSGPFLCFAFFDHDRPLSSGSVRIESTCIDENKSPGDSQRGSLYKQIRDSVVEGHKERGLGKAAGVDHYYLESVRITPEYDSAKVWGMNDDFKFTIVSLGGNWGQDRTWQHVMDREGLRLLKGTWATPIWATASYDFCGAKDMDIERVNNPGFLSLLHKLNIRRQRGEGFIVRADMKSGNYSSWTPRETPTQKYKREKALKAS